MTIIDLLARDIASGRIARDEAEIAKAIRQRIGVYLRDGIKCSEIGSWSNNQSIREAARRLVRNRARLA